MSATREAVAGVLDATPWFGSMSANARALVVDASRLHEYGRGDAVFFEGDRPTAVHVVASGLLRVFVTSFDGSEPTLALLSEGTVVGELGVLAEVPRSASVAALRRSQLVEVPAQVFRDVYDSEPSVARRLVELLSDRLRATSGGLADLTYLDLGGRLAKYLLREHERTGGATFDLTLTQTELGQMIGGARQTVNQLLQSLERANLIVVEGKKVRIVDRDGLQLRAMSAH